MDNTEPLERNSPFAQPDDSPNAAPFPQPVGTPPGGGAWTWDVHTGAWVSLDAPPAPAGNHPL